MAAPMWARFSTFSRSLAFCGVGLNSRRLFYRSCQLHKQKSATNKVKLMKKSDRFMQKILQGGSGKSRKKHWHNSWAISPTFSDAKSKRGPSTGAVRRSRQLSVVLYEYVTSLVNSGEVDPKLADLGIDIVKVWIPPDFTVINVYWLASGSSKDEEIQKLLPEASFKLRSALTSLHLMGNLPHVQFVKDLSAAKFDLVQTLLEKADMGPDFEPTKLAADMRFPPQNKYDRKMQNLSLQTEFSCIAEKMRNKDTEKLYGPTRDRDVKTGMINHMSCPPQEQTETSTIAEENKNEIWVEPNIKSPEEITTDFQRLNLRTDIYNVNHSSLLQQVLHSKRKFKDRYYDRKEPISEVVPPGLKTKEYSYNYDDIKKFLASKKKKEKLQNKSYMRSVKCNMIDGQSILDDTYQDENYDTNDDDDLNDDFDYIEEYYDDTDGHSPKNT